MNKAKLTMSAARGSDGLRIRLEDEISGTEVAIVHLSPADVYSMLGGAYLHLDGEISDHLDRIGKRMIVDSVYYRRSELSASTYEQMAADGEQLARADRPGWDEYSARRTNGGGVRVTLRRWEA